MVHFTGIWLLFDLSKIRDFKDTWREEQMATPAFVSYLLQLWMLCLNSYGEIYLLTKYLPISPVSKVGLIWLQCLFLHLQRSQELQPHSRWIIVSKPTTVTGDPFILGLRSQWQRPSYIRGSLLHSQEVVLPEKNT